MKTLIYILVIGALILISGTTLLLYYTQDFDEELKFKSTINIQDLEIQTSQRGSETYLSSARGEIGELKLKNSGYFTQVYRFPRLIGCIDLKSNVKPENSNIRDYQFQISFFQEGITTPSRSVAEIPLDKTETFILVGEYTTYNVPLSAFSSDNIRSISIYKLSENNKNPLDEGYPYDYRNKIGGNCNILRSSSTPLKVILFN